MRGQLDELAHSEGAGVFRRLSHWANYIIGDTFAPENEGLSWRDVGSIAEEQGKPPFDALLDLVIADDLRTVLWPKASDGDDASWRARVEVWDNPGAMVGGSDAGAHLDRMCGSNYPTSFLGDCLRKRKLVPMERAVQLMTAERRPSCSGSRPRSAGRGTAAPTSSSSIPRRSAPNRPRWSTTCPAGAHAWSPMPSAWCGSWSTGSRPSSDGKPTGNLPGALLRSGRDTVTVDPSPAGSDRLRPERRVRRRTGPSIRRPTWHDLHC